jgi:hypothetical protein
VKILKDRKKRIEENRKVMEGHLEDQGRRATNSSEMNGTSLIQKQGECYESSMPL